MLSLARTESRVQLGAERPSGPCVNWEDWVCNASQEERSWYFRRNIPLLCGASHMVQNVYPP